jgi:hypothetical protein
MRPVAPGTSVYGMNAIESRTETGGGDVTIVSPPGGGCCDSGSGRSALVLSLVVSLVTRRRLFLAGR